MATVSKPLYVWATLIAAVIIVFGLFVLVTGWRAMPLPREGLAVVDHIGPIDVDTPPVAQGQGSNRTQHIPLVAAGRVEQVYSPAPTLRVDGTDQLRSGQPVRFLVDPKAGLIYEATTQGKTLLAYEDTASNLGASARNRILLGFGALVLGGFRLARAHWRRQGGAV